MKLLVSALEASANLHLEPLLPHLRNTTLHGIFDRRFGEPLVESKAFSVMGFLEVLSKVPLARKSLKQMVALAAECDLVLLIDSPAFNVPLAKAIKKAHPAKKIVYYIPPQVWAWKAGRIPVVEANTDLQAVILPFEKQWWKKAVYVGHPLMQEIKTFRTNTVDEPVYAFLPGSRRGEIGRLWPTLKETAAKLQGRKLLAIPTVFTDDEIVEIYGDLTGFEVVRNAHEALLAARFAFVCSGTATLEAALIGTPFVLAYKAKWLDFQIARRLIKLPYAGLANLIFYFADRPPMHEEFLQQSVTAQNLLAAEARCDRGAFLKRSLELRSQLSSREESLEDLFLRIIKDPSG